MIQGRFGVIKRSIKAGLRRVPVKPWVSFLKSLARDFKIRPELFGFKFYIRLSQGRAGPGSTRPASSTARTGSPVTCRQAIEAASERARGEGRSLDVVTAADGSGFR